MRNSTLADFSALKMSFHYLLACIVSEKKSALINVFFFFLATFKILSLIFSNINMMCQHVYVCVCIILHEIH